jgi:hypothetical protein
MGAIAEAMVAFVQPLLDQTDGSADSINKAFGLSQVCFNLALLREERRETAMIEMGHSIKMDDEEFDAFQRDILLPMIRRHEAMFPMMHRRGPTDIDDFRSGHSLSARPRIPVLTQTQPKPDRYAPCPCNSGRKFKFCCGANAR